MTSEPTPNQVAHHELVGLQCRVVEAPDNADVEGVVVDESLHTLWIETMEGVKQVPKTSRVFEFRLEDSVVEVDGSAIEERPVDRLKMKQASVGAQ